MAALFKAISSSIRLIKDYLSLCHTPISEPSKDYRLVSDRQLVQKSQQKGEREREIAKSQGVLLG